MRSWQAGYWSAVAVMAGVWFCWDAKGARYAARLAHSIGDWFSQRATSLDAVEAEQSPVARAANA